MRKNTILIFRYNTIEILKRNDATPTYTNEYQQLTT